MADGRGSGTIPNYLAPAIFMLVWFPPCGIIAAISASKVKPRLAAGDVPGAFYASQRARTCCLAGGILGLILHTIVSAVIIMGAMGK